MPWREPYGLSWFFFAFLLRGQSPGSICGYWQLLWVSVFSLMGEREERALRKVHGTERSRRDRSMSTLAWLGFKQKQRGRVEGWEDDAVTQNVPSSSKINTRLAWTLSSFCRISWDHVTTEMWFVRLQMNLLCAKMFFPSSDDSSALTFKWSAITLFPPWDQAHLYLPPISYWNQQMFSFIFFSPPTA